MRLLTRGANPNYRNQEGSYCLHLAVLNNQMGQIELLCLHDADLTSLDRNGINPYELAKINNTTAIADRLLEIQFEFTDKISNFLFNKRPDHKSDQHFIVPNRIERYYSIILYLIQNQIIFIFKIDFYSIEKKIQ